MESDGLGLDFSLLDIDFVAAEDDRDVFADTDEITWVDLSASYLEDESYETYGASWVRSCK